MKLEKLILRGYTEKDALRKLGSVPLTEEKNYSPLRTVSRIENMTTFKIFLKWYNNKHVIPTLEALQKMMKFYDDRGSYKIRLGCTLPNLANICLHSSTNAKFYPFTKYDKDLLEKSEMIWLEFHPLFPHGKQLPRKPRFVIRTTCVGLLLESMQVNYIRSLWVKKCQRGCTLERNGCWFEQIQTHPESKTKFWENVNGILGSD